MPIPALITAGAALASSLGSYLGSRHSAKQQWRRELDASNTAVTRRVADMRAAGLSPQLAAGGEGATTPSVAAPNVDVNGVADTFSSGLQSGLSRKQSREIAERNAEIQQQQADSWSQVLSATAREKTAEARVKEHDASIFLNSPFPSGSNLFGVPLGSAGAVNGETAKDLTDKAVSASKQLSGYNRATKTFGVDPAKKALELLNSARQQWSNFSSRVKTNVDNYHRRLSK